MASVQTLRREHPAREVGESKFFILAIVLPDMDSRQSLTGFRLVMRQALVICFGITIF